MKASRYNIFIPQEGCTICYNSFSKSTLALNNRVYASFTTDAPDEFFIKYPTHYNTMVENGFLIPDEIDELNEIRFAHKLAVSDTRHFQLMIHPTLDCNLKCWYCYENHVHGSKMSEETQRRIVKLVENKIKTNAIDSVQLSYFGGEPLMFFNQIAYPLSSAVKEVCQKYGKPFSSFFVTNASLIDDAMVEKLKELNPAFQITLDGHREKHNQVRIGKENSYPTYDRIIHALYAISERISPQGNNKRIITLRINYDNDTLKHIDEILEDIAGLDKEKITIHLERVWQTMGQNDEGQQKLLIDSFRKLIYAGFSVNYGLFNKERMSCQAEKFDYAIINYDGNVYKCNGRNLVEENKDGTLNADGWIEWQPGALANRLGRTTFENPMCLACNMLPACMGPCSQKNMESNWRNLGNFCSKNVLDISLEEYLMLQFEMEFLQQKQRGRFETA